MTTLKKATITTLEVAEMMETEHAKLIRKLEGGKDRKGYINILTEAQMGVSDFFIPSGYKDASGKENKCYEVTRLGCDFLANKSTGEKGVLFTARYVKRFNEMEYAAHKRIYETKATSLGEVASFIKEMDRRMEKQGSAPWEICEAFRIVSEQFGIQLPDSFTKIPEYEQMRLPLMGGLINA